MQLLGIQGSARLGPGAFGGEGLRTRGHTVQRLGCRVKGLGACAFGNKL